MKAKKVLCELICIILIAAGFLVWGTDNVSSAVTRVDDPSPAGGDLAVFSSEISVTYPLFVGRKTTIGVDIHNLAITFAATWHLGDYAEYDFYQNTTEILDIEIRIRSSSDPTSTDVHLDGALIANFNSLAAFDIVTIHDITVSSGSHTIRVTQKSDMPAQGDSVVIDWIKIGNLTIEGELYDRSYGTDPSPTYRGVDQIVPCKIKTRFYIDGNLLAENDGVGSHTNSVPGDSLYSEVDFVPNNVTTNTSTIWVPSITGFHTITIEVLSGIGGDIDSSNNIANITVFVGIPPPILYINTSLDGKDSVLNWDPPKIPDLDHYLIYRSTSQIGFDFSSVWKNSSIDMEDGESNPDPLRTIWNDTDSANPSNITNYQDQYYYTIRVVNIYGQKSATSRTVGKWTRTFSEGVSTFSIPLEPLWAMNASGYLADMEAIYIKWIDPQNHTWTKRGENFVNDTLLWLGKGYEVKFNSTTHYTFCGMPGAMISYDDQGFAGFDYSSDAKNLTVTIEPGGDVNLVWQEPSCMDLNDSYQVYYSNTRDGFFGSLGIHYFQVGFVLGFGTTTLTHNGALANDPGARLYYMVVSFDAHGVRGASTYSIGIWTEGYMEQYDTIGIPLKTEMNYSSDWYCDNIPDTVGINYFSENYGIWMWHSTRMPEGAFDGVLKMTYGYQISTINSTKFTYIGI